MYISNSKYDLNDPLLKTFFKERGRALMKSIINDKDIICKYHKISAKTNDIIMNSDQNTISMSVTPTHDDLNEFVESFKTEKIENFIYKFCLDDLALSYILEKSEEHFSKLSSSRLIGWSDFIIDKYKDNWDWNKLCKNSAIIWNDEMVKKFEDKISFSYLSFNLNLRISATVLYRYENRWSWSGISGHPNLIMTLKNEIFNHPLTVWQSFKNNDSLSNIESLNDYNYSAHSFQHMGSRLDKSIEPSISTNPSIKWTQDLMFKYGDKIDFWSVALYAEIENSVLTQNMDRLNENRFYETVFTRHSDWRDNYPYYRNGWENLCMNLKTRINLPLLKALHKHYTEIISHNGSAREGHFEVVTMTRTSDLLPADKLDFDFVDLYQNFSLLGTKILSDYTIDQSIFDRIIKPAFLADSPWMIILLLNNSEIFVRSKEA